MSIHQFHYGKKFYQDKKTGYWISTSCPKIRAHVWVWKYHHNLVPKGWHVHHRDGDKSNNNIENLTIMSVANHIKHHFDTDPIRLQKAKDSVERIRPLTKEWHASKEGLAWHKLHGIKTWIERESFKITCKLCHKEAETKTYHQEFCSNACKSRWRRQEGLDNIERNCLICDKTFKVNKYSKVKTCSRKCGAKSALKERLQSLHTKMVAII